MLNFQVLRIRKVFNIKELFNFFDTSCSQGNNFIFFIDNKIARFDNLFAHDSIHLREFFRSLSSNHLTGSKIAICVNICRFSACPRNDQRCTSLVDQYRIDLINNRIMETSLDDIGLIDCHIIS